MNHFITLIFSKDLTPEIAQDILNWKELALTHVGGLVLL